MHSAFECCISVQDFWLNWGSSHSSQRLWANQCSNYSRSPWNELSVVLPGALGSEGKQPGEKSPSVCRQLWRQVHQLGGSRGLLFSRAAQVPAAWVCRKSDVMPLGRGGHEDVFELEQCCPENQRGKKEKGKRRDL